MNLQSMDYVITTAEEKSITKAAERLHITQQTLSAHICALEEELGCQLFVRHVPLEITFAGREFLKYAHSIQNEVKGLRRTFDEITGEERGILKVGVTHVRGEIILPEMIMDFSRKHPGINLKIIEDANDVLIQKLKKGEIDLCISDFATEQSKIQYVDLYREKVVFVCQKQLFHKIYGEEADEVLRRIEQEADFKILARCPMLISHAMDIAGRYARKWIATFDDIPQIKVEASNVELLLRLCRSGLGGCFCPDIILRDVFSREQMKDMLVISLGKESEYDIRIGWKDDWRVISAFVESAKRKTKYV